MQFVLPHSTFEELSPNVEISRPFPFYFPSLQIVNDSLRCAKLNCANNLDNKLNSSRRQEHISLHYQDLGDIIKQMLYDAQYRDKHRQVRKAVVVGEFTLN